MAPYERALTHAFLDDLRTHRRNRKLMERVGSKLREIAEQPEHYKPLRGPQAGIRRVHVGPYVILFEIRGSEVIFHALRHHDEAYK